jgi:predicted SAM-dependent methyltransferase
LNNIVKRFIEVNKNFLFEVKIIIKSFITYCKVKLFAKKYYGAKLELGCGLKAKNGFVGVDIHRQVECPFDLRIGLPFKDNSISFIYTEHALEHLYFDEFNSILTECFRVLMKDAKLSIVVPRVDRLLKAYKASDLEFRHAIKYAYPSHLKTRLDIINYMLYMGQQHKNSFDEDNLLAALKNIGFKNVKLREFDPGLDLEERKHDSLYCECMK